MKETSLFSHVSFWCISCLFSNDTAAVKHSLLYWCFADVLLSKYKTLQCIYRFSAAKLSNIHSICMNTHCLIVIFPNTVRGICDSQFSLKKKKKTVVIVQVLHESIKTYRSFLVNNYNIVFILKRIYFMILEFVQGQTRSEREKQPSHEKKKIQHSFAFSLQQQIHICDESY